MEGRLINVRKLVSLDIVLHGPKFIMAEFGIGTPFIFLAAWALIESGLSALLGWYLVLTGVNYIPLLAYAIFAVRRRTWMQDVEADLARDRHYVRKYSLQQFLIFIPFSIVVLAAIQASERNESG